MRISSQVLLASPQTDIIEADYETLDPTGDSEDNSEAIETETETFEEAVRKALAPVTEKGSPEEKARAIFDEIGGSIPDIAKMYVTIMQTGKDENLRFKALQDIAKIQKVLVPPDKTPSNSIQITVHSGIVDTMNVLNPQR